MTFPGLFVRFFKFIFNGVEIVLTCCCVAMGLFVSGQALAQSTPVLVLNSLDATVSVIDPKTWQVVKTIPTGKEPHHLYLTPDNKSFIVANAASNSLTFIDPLTTEVQRVIKDIMDPYHLRFSPDMRWFVTAGNRLNHIDIYRWDGIHPVLAKRIPTSRTPSHLWIDSKSTTVYGTMQDSDELVVIDLGTQSIKSRTPTGSMPADVFLTADDKTLLVGLTGSNQVQVFDVSGAVPREIKRIKTGAGAHSFRSAGDRKHLFVSNRADNTISRIDLTALSVVETFAAPGGPDDMEISGDGKTMVFTSRWIKKLSVLDMSTRKLVRQIPVGTSPHGVWTLDHLPR
jgi:YVTN family beta-propeller protein